MSTDTYDETVCACRLLGLGLLCLVHIEENEDDDVDAR